MPTIPADPDPQIDLLPTVPPGTPFTPRRRGCGGRAMATQRYH